MSNILKLILSHSCLVLIFFTSCGRPDGRENQSPNILFLAIDDLRPELNCYGVTQIKTPNIDQVAKQGIVFDRAYCNIPVCGASRPSVMTGIWPTAKRFVDYDTWAQEDVPDAKTLPQVFKEAGYTTISNGKIFHHQTDTEHRSWSEKPWQPMMSHMTSFDPKTTARLSKRSRGLIYEMPEVPDSAYTDGKVARKTISDLKRLKRSGKPFFLASGFIRPHMPFYAPKKYWNLYDRDSLTTAKNRYRPEMAPKQLKGSGEYNSYHHGDYVPATEEWHRMMKHGYYASTSYADQLVGDVPSELSNLGLAENTIVVLWGDHGWHLGEHEFWGKHNTMHNALRIPLIIKVPGQTKGQHSSALIENIDLYPTLCELAGLSAPPSIMGKSFKHVIENPSLKVRETVYARFKVADAIVTQQYNYSLYNNGEEMLYDLNADPEENKNIANDSSFWHVLEEMRNALAEKQQIANNYP